MLTSLKVALKIAVRGQLRASRVTCSSAHLFSSLINAKDGKACAKPEYSQCWREYLPTAAEVILLLHHHHTFLKKRPTPGKLLYANGDRFLLLELFPSEPADSIIQPSGWKKH